MEFQCHECQTRYRIADERVAGKVLKIRCKNCKTILSVSQKSKRPKATIPPPEKKPDLEWHFSIDGVQHGPFSEEQGAAWLSKHPEDELVYCWNETMDDWMDVGGVSAFAQVERPSPSATQDWSAKVAAAPVVEASRTRNPSASSEDLFELGEVSRVVRLQDLAPPGAAVSAEQARNRLEGESPAADLFLEQQASQKSKSKVGIVWVIAGVGALGALVFAILAMQSEGGGGGEGVDVSEQNFGQTFDKTGAVIGSSKGSRRKTTRTKTRVSSGTTTQGGTSGRSEGDLPVGNLEPLTPDDIIRKSRSTQMTFTRCYERAKRKDPFLKVSKLIVDLRVEPSGTVSKVGLNKLSDHMLGKCLSSGIRRWKFRPSTKGISSQFPVVFQRQ